MLNFIIRIKGISFTFFALGIELHEFFCHIADGFPDVVAGFLPLRRGKPIQLDIPLILRADVSGY